MNNFPMRRLIKMLCISGLLGVSTSTMASGFQLWEQDGASIGSYHAGYAALANDASTAFYNPAGMTRIKNQQLVIGTVGIMTDFKYKGNLSVNTIIPDPISLTAQGGNFSFIPALQYVAPLSDRASFGFSIDVPFGLKTNYGSNTELRYAATLSSATVIDVSPSLAFQVTDKASLGFGPDLQRMYGEFDQVGGVFNPSMDTPSTNKANDTAYGYHLGGLYQFTPTTRVGLSYHSQVVHHLSGTSKFIGPIADILNDGSIISRNATVNVTLPPYTALSGYHLICPKVALMGTVIYTQWSTFKNLVLNNVAGIGPMGATTNLQVIIPENYRDTWNLSLGTEYYATDKITLRSAIGYDQTPTRDAYRNIQLPDNDRYLFAFGGHYQATKTVGVDLSWAHVFINRATINPPPQVTGIQISTATGSVTGGADVFGAQLTWDIV